MIVPVAWARLNVPLTALLKFIDKVLFDPSFVLPSTVTAMF